MEIVTGDKEFMREHRIDNLVELGRMAQVCGKDSISVSNYGTEKVQVHIPDWIFKELFSVYKVTPNGTGDLLKLSVVLEGIEIFALAREVEYI